MRLLFARSIVSRRWYPSVHTGAWARVRYCSGQASVCLSTWAAAQVAHGGSGVLPASGDVRSILCDKFRSRDEHIWPVPDDTSSPSDFDSAIWHHRRRTLWHTQPWFSSAVQLVELLRGFNMLIPTLYRAAEMNIRVEPYANRYPFAGQSDESTT
ncbi:hypothetical protein GGX14DRAFT_400318 [Mycena pura]|uniref:Uncharacterized protein n=1 Tax=Mycena pura TaxID=153505 RepID=A0AAD6V9Z6_9AGAR|nr:hypothetical protein GGX14DRAFT_400318 [Mycena pura]